MAQERSILVEPMASDDPETSTLGLSGLNSGRSDCPTVDRNSAGRAPLIIGYRRFLRGRACNRYDFSLRAIGCAIRLQKSVARPTG